MLFIPEIKAEFHMILQKSL